MSMLFSIIYASKCKGTHHKLAMDALKSWRFPLADGWRAVFLSHADQYIKGSKAPDDDFKDFKNHVLHVGENDWGGAPAAAESWYAKTVDLLRAQDWPAAVYAAGVLSHYFTDPFMPFHTGQSEAEGVIHRAAEWSITTSYDQLRQLLDAELGGEPTAECPVGAGWLGRMVRQGAREAHQHYRFLIDHYDLAAGVKNPPHGFDGPANRVIAKLLGQACAGLSAVLAEAIDDARQTPPAVSLTIPAVLAALSLPMKAVLKKISDANERKAVEAIFNEYQQTGKVIENLPEDEKTVRALHAEEVLRIPLAQLDRQPIGPVGAHYGKKDVTSTPLPAPRPAPIEPVATLPSNTSPPVKLMPVAEESVVDELVTLPIDFAKPTAPATTVPSPGSCKFYLRTSDHVAEAPSIGPKTAEKLEDIGIKTVADLLAAKPETVAKALASKSVTAVTVIAWQQQSKLMCAVATLRGYEAQILVACAVTTPEQLASETVDGLSERVNEFCHTAAGQRVLRTSNPPEATRISQWIDRAQSAAVLAAA